MISIHQKPNPGKPEAPIPMLEEEPRTPARIQEVHFPPVPAPARALGVVVA